MQQQEQGLPSPRDSCASSGSATPALGTEAMGDALRHLHLMEAALQRSAAVLQDLHREDWQLLGDSTDILGAHCDEVRRTARDAAGELAATVASLSALRPRLARVDDLETQLEGLEAAVRHIDAYSLAVAEQFGITDD